VTSQRRLQALCCHYILFNILNVIRGQKKRKSIDNLTLSFFTEVNANAIGELLGVGAGVSLATGVAGASVVVGASGVVGACTGVGVWASADCCS
jgi:TPP-dependent pyruvate/acetoin dehydrogenase alpha subunit